MFGEASTLISSADMSTILELDIPRGTRVLRLFHNKIQ